MAAIIGNSIINDESLKLHLDAKNSLSAGVDSSYWYDLSGNQNLEIANVTLNSNGYYTKDNTSTLRTSKNNFQIIDNDGITASMLFRINSDTGTYQEIFYSIATGGYSGWGVTKNNSDWRIRAEVRGSDNVRNYFYQTELRTAGNWNYLTCVFTKTYIKSFLNGIWDIDYFNDCGNVYVPGNYLYLGYYGSRSTSYWYMDGDISNVLIYNRVLSDNEILQNYRTFQNRF